MDNKVTLSVIIPAYQEEENLKELLPELKKVLTELTDSFEVIIVDTLSPLDHTELLCQQLGLTYIRRSPTNDFGDAVKSGINHSSGKYVIFMDGDGSHNPHFVKELYRYRKEADVVIASRYVSGGMTQNPPALIFMSWVLNGIYAVVLGLKVKDISNSFKLYRGDLLRSLHLSSKNFDIIQEILFKLTRKKRTLCIKELPFTFEKRKYGETKRQLFRFILSYFFSTMRIRMSVFFKGK